MNINFLGGMSKWLHYYSGATLKVIPPLLHLILRNICKWVISQIFHIKIVGKTQDNQLAAMDDYQHSACVSTSDIVTPRRCVTISTPQGGAVLKRLSADSFNALHRATGNDLYTRFKPCTMLWFSNELNIAFSDWTWKSCPQQTISTCSNRCTAGS